MMRGLTIAVVSFGLMSALGYFVKQQTPDFVEGMAVGGLGATLLIYIAHKLGARAF